MSLPTEPEHRGCRSSLAPPVVMDNPKFFENLGQTSQCLRFSQVLVVSSMVCASCRPRRGNRPHRLHPTASAPRVPADRILLETSSCPASLRRGFFEFIFLLDPGKRQGTGSIPGQPGRDAQSAGSGARRTSALEDADTPSAVSSGLL